jgi:hypothetical protein
LPPRGEGIEVRTMVPITRPMAMVLVGSTHTTVGGGRSVASAMEATVAIMDEDFMGLLEAFRQGLHPLPRLRQVLPPDLDTGSDWMPS